LRHFFSIREMQFHIEKYENKLLIFMTKNLVLYKTQDVDRVFYKT